MIRTILEIIFIVSAIVFIYPMKSIIIPIGTSIFANDNGSYNKLTKEFGEVKIESYVEYKELETDDVYGKCYAIYLNEEQANSIEMQINKDESWTSSSFKEGLMNNYKKLNINVLGKSYYYLIEFDKDYNTIETKREVLDNKKIEWYKSAIYDCDNKILYYYCRYYEK